jgi:Domain of unknown function (DUF4167)
MRDFKGMKRQRSRNRGGGNGGNKPQQNANRAFESNGPEGVKIRGAAQHVFEKYQQLARDALTAGDRVLAEGYQQHAEHYFRLLRAMQPNRPASDIIGRDAFVSGYDLDFEDESGGDGGAVQETSESEGGGQDGQWRQQDNNRYENRDRYQNDRPRDDRPRDDRPRDDRPRDDRPRDDRPRDDRTRDDRTRDDRPRDDRPRDDRPNRDRNFNRDDRPRDDRPRDDRPRDDRPRDDRPRDDRPREDRPNRDRNFNRDDRPRDDKPRDDRPREDRPREDRPRADRFDRQDRGERVDPLAVVEPRATPLTQEAEPSASPVLRSHDGDVSHAPAFLKSQPRGEPVAEAAEAAPKPRKRRAPRAADAAPAATGPSEEG